MRIDLIVPYSSKGACKDVLGVKMVPLDGFDGAVLSNHEDIVLPEVIEDSFVISDVTVRFENGALKKLPFVSAIRLFDGVSAVFKAGSILIGKEAHTHG